VHALAADRTPAVLWELSEAELAEHAPAVELVHALAGEWSAAAVAAGCVGVSQGANAAAHEHGGKIGHGNLFAGSPKIPLAPYEYPAPEMGTPVLSKAKKARY
jgi:hypothetical protein